MAKPKRCSLREAVRMLSRQDSGRPACHISALVLGIMQWCWHLCRFKFAVKRCHFCCRILEKKNASEALSHLKIWHGLLTHLLVIDWTSNMYPTMPQWTWFWASLFFVLHRSRPNDCSGALCKAWKKRLPSQNCVVLRLLCLRRVLTCVCLRLHAKLVLWRRSVFKFKMQIFLKEFCLASPSQTKSGWKAVTKKI